MRDIKISKIYKFWEREVSGDNKGVGVESCKIVLIRGISYSIIQMLLL